MGDGVAFPHGQFTVHHHMNVEREVQAAFADATLFNLLHALDLGGEPAHLLDNFWGHRSVHDFVDGAAQEMQPVPRDDAAGEERRPVIRRLVARTADNSDENADESRR